MKVPLCFIILCICGSLGVPSEEEETEYVRALRQKIREKLRLYREQVMETFELDIPSLSREEEDDPQEISIQLDIKDAYEFESNDNEQYETNVKENDLLTRRKRATITADNPLLLGRRRRKIATSSSGVPHEGSYVLRSVFRLLPQYFDHVKTFEINAIVIKNQTFLFTLELTPGGRTEIAAYIVGTSLNPKEITRVEAPGATSLEVIKIEKYYYILPLVYNWTATNSEDPMDVGSNLYKIDLIRRTLIKVQTIRTAHARSSVFWKGSGEEANAIYLAVAPEFQDTPRGRRFHVDIPCYMWQGGYFDYVSSVPANNPQAIRHFNIFSHDYLAVANYQDDSGSTNIHSEVFKYYHKESRFISFQRIRTYGAKDIQHFSFKSEQREEHFLAIANHCHKDENGRPDYRVKSVIMKFASQRFIPFKSFYTYGALQFLPVTLEDKFYLVLAEMRKIRIFQYNGWSFVQTYLTVLPEMGLAFYSIRLRPFIYENQPFFAVSSVAEEYQGGIYSVQFDQKNDYSRLTSDLEKWCLAARKRMYEINVTKLEEDVDLAPKTTDRELFLSQPLTFEGPLTVSKVFTNKLSQGERDFDDKLAKVLLKDEEQLQAAANGVAELEERMMNVVFRNKSHEIQGNVIFNKVDYYNPELVTENAHLKNLNDRNMETLLKNVIYTNKDLHLKRVEIEHVQLSFNLEAINKLNGAPLSDYAVKNNLTKNSTFLKKNTFKKEVTLSGQVLVKGLLSGVDFNQPSFLLASENQTFKGLVKIDNSTVNKLYTKFLNGRDVDFFKKQAVPLNENVEITGLKSFKNVSINTFNVTGPVNGFNINSLYANAIYITEKESQNFTGTTRFQNLTTPQINLKNKLVNGKYDLEKKFVNITGGSFVLGDVILTQDAFVQELNVTEKLNNFEVKNGDLGILLTDSPQVQLIKNKKVAGIHFEIDVEADGLVDGVDLKNWTSTKRIQLRSNNIHRKFTIHGNLSAPRVKVMRDFKQGTDHVLPILKHIAPLSSKKLPGTCTLIFDNLTVEGNTQVSKEVNGQRPSNWILKNHKGGYNVTGKKNFLGELTLEQDCKAKSLFASFDPSAENILKVIPDLLINGIEQAIQGTVAFTDLLKVTRLDCPTAVLDGVPFENLLLKTGFQEVDIESHFEGIVKVEDDGMDVQGNISLQFINDVNLTEAIEDTLRTGEAGGKTQVIQGEYQLEGGLRVNDMETDGHIGEIDLGGLFHSIIRRDRKALLVLNNTHLTFENGIDSQKIEFTGEMNEIPDSQWGKMWLLTTGNQTVFTKVQFLDNLFADSGLFVDSGLVGEIDVLKMNLEILRTDEGGRLGHVEFEDGLTVLHGITMGPRGRVNGLDLRKDVLHQHGPKGFEQIVSGEKTFENGWTISENGSLQVEKLDDVDIPALLEFLFEKNPQAFENDTLIVMGDLLLSNEPNITSNVNDRNLKNILKNIWFTNENVTLVHRVSFSHLNLSVGGHFLKKGSLLAGINLDDLKDGYVSRSKNQTWTGNVTIEGGVAFEKLKVKDLRITDGLLNDVNLDEFFSSILINGTNQTLVGEFSINNLHANHIELGEDVLINGMDLLNDLMTLHGHNNVTGMKTFENLEIGELVLGMETLLDGINLTEWDAKALKTTGENIIDWPMDLDQFSDSGDIKVGGQVDGVTVDKDHILLKNGSQTIIGEMIILDVDKTDFPETAALTAPEIDIDGLFNSYDLNTTFGNLVRRSEYENDTTTPLVIEGEKKFMSPIRVHHIRAEKLYQGLNMSKLLGDFYSGLVIPPNLTFRASDRYEALNRFAQQVIHVSNKRAVFLEYFILSQEIYQESILYTKVLYGTRTPTVVLGLQESDSRTTESWWAYSVTTDYYQRQIGARIRIQGEVIDYEEIDWKEKTGHFIIISVSSVKNRPASISLENKRSAAYADINKASGRPSKTFILRAEEGLNPVVTQTIHAKQFGPLETFLVAVSEELVYPCVLVTPMDSNNGKGNGEILCLDSNGAFKPYQTIPLNNPILTTSMEAMNRTMLMIATKEVAEDPDGVVELWMHLDSDAKFTKESCIPVYNPVSMDAVYGTNRNLFLAVASGAVSGSNLNYLGSVFMYRYSLEKKEFEKTQTLEIDFPLEVRLLWTEPSTEVLLFVLTANPMNNVLVYKYQGVAGWNLKAKFTSEGGRKLEVSDFTYERVYKAQVMVTSSNATRIYSAQFKGLSADRYAPVEDEIEDELFIDAPSSP